MRAGCAGTKKGKELSSNSFLKPRNHLARTAVEANLYGVSATCDRTIAELLNESTELTLVHLILSDFLSFLVPFDPNERCGVDIGEESLDEVVCGVASTQYEVGKRAFPTLYACALFLDVRAFVVGCRRILVSEQPTIELCDVLTHFAVVAILAIIKLIVRASVVGVEAVGQFVYVSNLLHSFLPSFLSPLYHSRGSLSTLFCSLPTFFSSLHSSQGMGLS